jgi:hypothetical protein
MQERITIEKGRKLPASLDYEALRKEGLSHIESLSSDLWTDYNVHDPGITILEALCYAITELGYRSRFDVKDLVTDDTGHVAGGQTFFTAKQIFTVNPLTINDYRKLLVDIEGVSNAFLLAADTELVNGVPTAVNEVLLYADCKADALTTTPNGTPVVLSGLYRALLALDSDDRFGDLNDGDIMMPNPELPGAYVEGEFFFSIELSSWKEADFAFADGAAAEANIQSAVLTKTDGGWECELTLHGFPDSKRFGVHLTKKPASGDVSTSDAQAMFANKAWLAGVFAEYFQKITLAQTIVKRATKILHEHRNLCEDFISITTVDNEQIAFCFDVDAKPEADIEKTQAEIFYAIENYLNPPIAFYTLKELLQKGLTVDDIFNGPVLHHGFVDAAQFETTNLRTVIYASDIINLLMDIEGVVAVRHFMMTKYDKAGKPVPGYISQPWCMHITPLHKPVLHTGRSKILLFKSGFPFIPRYDEVKDTIRLLHTIRSKGKLSRLQDDIPVPKGVKRDTESHWPVQYDLPITYGVGVAGLPEGVTPQRRAQQRQLKAYLLFYEQLLADFFSQLSNARELFSTNALTHTYYAQFLSGIKDTEDVYSPALATALLRDAINTPDSTAADKNAWQKLYETKEVFQDRRNRFLDHLLGRFAESFNDYALMMYRINYDEGTEEKLGFDELTAAKTSTLKQYDDISANRGKAFNYFPQTEQTVGGVTQFLPDTSKYWDTDNVSGLEKRICALTGIKDSSRRFLYCIREIEIICTEKEIEVEGDKKLKCVHSFTVTSLNGIELVSKEYDTKAEAEAARDEAIAKGADPANYSVLADGGFKLTFADLLTGTNEFETEQEAKKAIGEIAEEFARECNDPKGLHLIEHILLRPRTAAFDLMPVCLHNCDCPCEADPYSFRASVILPYWPGHFDHPAFRQYFENKIREEAPAHLMLKICWLNNDLLRKFELRYKRWIETLAAYAMDKASGEAGFLNAANKMIEILSQLHSEHPQATLHNCDESKEGRATVVLNKTVLGTFKT